jgi:hypothetical protein
MIPLKKTFNKYPDLYFKDRSITYRFSLLLGPEYHDCTLEELKEKAIEILNLEDTIVSDKKKKEYILNFEKQKSKVQLQFYLSNIVMKGSNLTL